MQIVLKPSSPIEVNPEQQSVIWRLRDLIAELGGAQS